jgi:Tfp pilus assembly major pilin PilA
MTSRYLLLPAALAMAGTLLLGAAGCATTPPPTVQMTVAKASVETANAAGAIAYAPAELRLANDKLAKAQKAMADKDHTEALHFAEQAHTDAQLATAKTQSAKARKAADDAQADARVPQQDLNRNAPQTGAEGTR